MMPWFKCFVSGKNFPGSLIGKSSLVGFYTTRYTEASSAKDAKRKALDELRKDSRLRLPQGEVSPSGSKVDFEEILEIHGKDVPAKKEGFVWYLMEEA
jgi:hypothetical protein